MILLTGSTGFLGRHILLENTKEEMLTLSRSNHSVNKNLVCDLSISIPDLTPYDINRIIHCAGLAHVHARTPDEHRSRFEDVNIKGTRHLLEGLDSCEGKPDIFIYISTVAVYGKESGRLISEGETPNPVNAYGTSKLKAEKLIESWCRKRGIDFLILRLPLIVGVDPPGNLGKMKQSISKSRYLRIINNHAQKSMVLAEDVASLVLRDSLVSGTYNLTDGRHPSMLEVENALVQRTGKKIRITLPQWMIKFLAKMGDIAGMFIRTNVPISTAKIRKLTSTLTFDDTKARKELNWQPVAVLPFIQTAI